MAEEFRELTDDELKLLSPQAKLQYLKALEIVKRRQLKDQQKKVSKQLDEAEELIKETEEEIEEELAETAEDGAPKADDEDLEALVEKEKVETTPEDEPYKTGATYKTEPDKEYQTGTPQRDELEERLGRTAAGATYKRDGSSEDGSLYQSRTDERDRPGVGKEYNAPSQDRTESNLSTDILKNVYRK